MSIPLRVLIVEDSEDDALLLLRALRHGGYNPEFERVETAAAMKTALARQIWDIIISDYSMPYFSGPAALLVARQSKLDLPFIVLSGAIGEETAVEVMKAGAHDYIMKDNPARLIPAIRRGLSETEVRRERRQAEEALRASEERFRLMFELSPEAIVLLDVKGNVLNINGRVSDWLGYTPDEVIGTNLLELPFLPGESRARAGESFARRMRGEEIPPYELFFVAKNGEGLTGLIMATSIKDSEGIKIYDLVMISDITERKRMEEDLKNLVLAYQEQNQILTSFHMELEKSFTKATRAEKNLRKARDELEKRVRERTAELAMTNEELQSEVVERKRTEATMSEAKEAAEAANRAKSEFLARMSHEIRTPIHGIMGMLELILDTALRQEQREYLDIADSSVNSLLAVINNILDFSKIEAGQFNQEDTDFDLRTILEHTVETLALAAHRKGLELSCHLPPEIPTALVGDVGHLRQVLLNLTHNAIKFTEQGEVVVQVAMAAERKQEVALYFKVRDTGIGVPEDKLEPIFEAFHQVDGSASRQYGGTGLGLAISKQLVELMGGRLQVESRAGEGSTFHFKLKFKKQADDGTPVASPEAVTGWQGLPVLVVDDNETNRLILRGLLGYWGFKVTEANDGPAGLRELKKAKKASRHFRLVLLDKAVSGMNGYNLVKRIQDDPALRKTIVMMLPSDNVPGDADRYRELGIPAYLVKPIKQSALLGAVRTMLEAVPEAEKGKELEPVASALAAGPRRRILLAEDDDAGQLIARKALGNAGHTVLIANNGLEVLRILEKEDFDLILMDMEMPQMDGLEATRVIRRRETKSGQHVPILAMTAYALKEDKERCLEAGMDSYIPKPVKLEELYTAIRDLLSSDMEGESASPVDLEAALRVVNGNEELLQEAVGLFLEQYYPRQLKILREGLEQQNARAVKIAAHGIKGAASNLGGRALSSVAQRLEAKIQEDNLTGVEDLLDELEAELERFTFFFSDLASSRKELSTGG